ncbi:hypothetical protein [Hyphomonas sp.]|uniref:hypothetical protein n=1 Tax=Hyphomonas sp. TaxID=87 RepID=UPI003919C4EA
MRDTAPEAAPETAQERDDRAAMPPAQSPPWGRYTAVMAGLGAVSVYLIQNWGSIEPVLESPSVIVLSMLTVFGLGGLSAYWLLARPYEQRLYAAESVIKRLRVDERQLLVREGELKAQVKALEVTVQFLREEMQLLKQQFEAAVPPRQSRRTPKVPKG